LAFPPEVQALLQQIRQVIHTTIPNLGETISYGMPTFTLNGTYLVSIAAHKKHIGLYPAPTGVEEFHEAMALYGRGNGTLKFPLNKPTGADARAGVPWRHPPALPCVTSRATLIEMTQDGIIDLPKS
jgi:uncharacterized protein YdhG (YjbR/CyaY superfamily)